MADRAASDGSWWTVRRGGHFDRQRGSTDATAQSYSLWGCMVMQRTKQHGIPGATGTIMMLFLLRGIFHDF